MGTRSCEDRHLLEQGAACAAWPHSQATITGNPRQIHSRQPEDSPLRVARARPVSQTKLSSVPPRSHSYQCPSELWQWDS